MRRSTDPLMGWTSSSNTNQQVRLVFDNRAEAETYAHLEHLRIAGKAESRWEEGRLRYTVA